MMSTIAAAYDPASHCVPPTLRTLQAKILAFHDELYPAQPGIDTPTATDKRDPIEVHHVADLLRTKNERLIGQLRSKQVCHHGQVITSER